MFCSINFIDNAVAAYPERELSFMVADEGFAIPRIFRERFDFGKDSHEELPVGFMKRLKIGFCLLRKLDTMGHLIFSLDLKSLRDTVLPFLSCSFARDVGDIEK